jgi:hypothetical protein
MVHATGLVLDAQPATFGGPLHTLTAWLACGDRWIVMTAAQQMEPPANPGLVEGVGGFASEPMRRRAAGVTIATLEQQSGRLIATVSAPSRGDEDVLSLGTTLAKRSASSAGSSSRTRCAGKLPPWGFGGPPIPGFGFCLTRADGTD